MNNLCCKLNLLVSSIILVIIVSLLALGYYETEKFKYHADQAISVVDNSANSAPAPSSSSSDSQDSSS
jgi:hypothetical protein